MAVDLAEPASPQKPAVVAGADVEYHRVTASEICFEAVEEGVGACWSSIYPTYFAPKTERLRKDAYEVYVVGRDSRCQSCGESERSNSLKLVIPGVNQTCGASRCSPCGGELLGGAATLELCDSVSEESSSTRVVIWQARLRQGRLLASRQMVSTWTFAGEWGSGCGPLLVCWRIPPALARCGDTYRVTFSVVNADGDRSRTMARRLRS